MEIRELISFYHVARLRSVSKAGEHLAIGQPTVTTHLQKIEREFGVVLFDRIKRPIQLTSDGVTFYELAKPIVEGITEGVETLKMQMDYPEHRGSFVVGAYPDLVLHHLPPVGERVQEPLSMGSDQAGGPVLFHPHGHGIGGRSGFSSGHPARTRGIQTWNSGISSTPTSSL